MKFYTPTFGIADKIEDGNAELSDKLYKSYQEKTFQVIKKVKETGLPNDGQQLRLITMSSFNSIAFIKLISDTEVIEEMILVIFAINISAARILIDLFESGKIKKMKLVVSSIRNAGYTIKSKAVEMLSKQSKIEMMFVNSHAKISAIRTANNHYVIEGSGNFSYNGRIEQYIIDNDQDLFNFTKNWIIDMQKSMKAFKDYKSVNSEIVDE
jgi:predicted DNA binding protein